MVFLRVLRRLPIALLWSSQVLSSMGDYLYSLAVIWLAVQTVGSNAGVVAAAQAVAQLVFGLLGGVCADRWDRRKVMILADSVRAVAVLCLPLLAVYGALQFWHLVLVAVIIGSLGSLFDPALQASLPSLAEDEHTLRATNGLMDITARLARVLGPGMAGLLVMLMPLTQFFTLDAISFAISAGAIMSLGRHVVWKPRTVPNQHSGVKGIWLDIRGAVLQLAQHRPLAWLITINGIANLPWSAAFTIGVPLLVNDGLKMGVGAVGLIGGAYGVGNVLSNLVIGSITIRRRVPLMFIGHIVVGSGFLLMGFSTSLPLAMLGSAFAACGGPMGDIIMHTMMQTDLPAAQLGKVFSLRMVLANVGASLGLLIAVPLFRYIPVTPAIALCSLMMVVLGITGLCRFGFSDGAIPVKIAESFDVREHVYE